MVAPQWRRTSLHVTDANNLPVVEPSGPLDFASVASLAINCYSLTSLNHLYFVDEPEDTEVWKPTRRRRLINQGRWEGGRWGRLGLGGGRANMAAGKRTEDMGGPSNPDWRNSIMLRVRNSLDWLGY